MQEQTFRERVLSRRPCFGGWCQVGHATSAEILARAGFDWVAVDLEHTDMTVERFAELARAVGGAAAPLARVRENATLAIRQALDMGAQGVIVPLVGTAEEARRAVAAAKYPPLGVRGFAFTRANAWGVDFDAAVARANAETVVIVMIESREAVANIEAILAVEGVDGVLIGPYDLSGSYGIPGRTADPQVREGARRVVAACAAAGKAAGLHVVLPTPAQVRGALDDGYTLLALGMDTVFLAEGARAALAAARGVGGAAPA